MDREDNGGEPLDRGQAIDRIDALLSMRRFEDALREAAQAVASSPEDAGMRLQLARVYVSMDETPLAREQCEEAVAMMPDFDTAHALLAATLMQQEDFDRAVDHARTAARIDPDDAYNLYVLALCEFNVGNADEALESARASIELEPQDGDLHEMLGDLLFSIKNNPKEAIPHYHEALRLEPENPSLHASLGRALAAQEKTFEAADCYLRAVRLEPANADYREQLFNHIHHAVADAPASMQGDILAQFDDSVGMFYLDELGRKGWSGRLRLGSVMLMWLGGFVLLTLFVTLMSGEPVGKVLALAVVLGVVWLGMMAARWGMSIWRYRRWRKRREDE